MIHHLYQQSIISLEQFEIAIHLNSLQDRLSKKYSKNLDIKQDIDKLWDLVDDFIALEVRGYP
jgi:RNAse (barnase) inhibitor barstar